MAEKWRNVRKNLGPKREAAIREQVQQEALEMTLREVREMAGMTQSEAAAALEVMQSQLSKLERRDDHLVSTLRRYVEALGGELEVTAKFGDKSIRLQGV